VKWIARSHPEQHTREERAGDEGEQDDGAGEAEGADQDVGEPRGIVWRLEKLDDDRLLLLYQNFSNASSASVRTATPLGPLL
jgi:hypothetical protein